VRRRVLLLLCPVLVAAACSSGSSAAKKVSGGGDLPSVSGSYGAKPTIKATAAKPSAKVVKQVLSQGKGPVVTKGSLLVADYLGQVWKGKVFDNSYDRGQPAAFPIGVGKVIPAWDETLVGVKAGSRVELVVPPAKGYGTQGNSQAGIKGTDTLIFVVDVIQSIAKDAGGDPKAKVQTVPGLHPLVTGSLGVRPKVAIPPGLKQPTKVVATVIAKGTGAAVRAGLLVLQFEAVTWVGKSAGSTWQAGLPQGVPIGVPQQPGVFDLLVGVPVGSRVLLQLPARPAQGQSPASESIAAVLDVVTQPPAAKNASH